MNIEQGLDNLIEVVDGNFEDIHFQDSSFDIVWSQDAMLHSGARGKVVSEVSRVLTESGNFIFTDLMQSVDCPEDVLQPILDRLHLESMATAQFYREVSDRNGLTEVRFEQLTDQLVTHYDRVLQETRAHEAQLRPLITEKYLENMKKGLAYWIDGGKKGYLEWGIFHFKKMNPKRVVDQHPNDPVGRLTRQTCGSSQIAWNDAECIDGDDFLQIVYTGDVLGQPASSGDEAR